VPIVRSAAAAGDSGAFARRRPAWQKSQPADHGRGLRLQTSGVSKTGTIDAPRPANDLGADRITVPPPCIAEASSSTAVAEPVAIMVNGRIDRVMDAREIAGDRDLQPPAPGRNLHLPRSKTAALTRR
jgi:hypothetical protein